MVRSTAVTSEKMSRSTVGARASGSRRKLPTQSFHAENRQTETWFATMTARCVRSRRACAVRRHRGVVAALTATPTLALNETVRLHSAKTVRSCLRAPAHCVLFSALAHPPRALLSSRACEEQRNVNAAQKRSFIQAAQRRGVISMCTLPPRTPSILSRTHTRSLTCWSSPSSSHCFDSTPLALALSVPNNAQNLCRLTTTHDDTESARVGLATAPVWTCWNCCKSRTLEAAA